VTRAGGALAEARARTFLEVEGLRCLCCNFSCKLGELDLVMTAAEGVLVVVEVRHRSDDAQVSALESLTPAKLRRLILATEVFLQANPEHADDPVRFDVVAITGDAHDGALDWLPDAFRP
jgi:putative endonuclease